jgi:hypothetical protein
VKRLDHPVAVFVIRAHATDVAGATANDTHTNSQNPV